MSSEPTLASLRADTGFKLTPMQCGPNDDAFLGFLNFAFSPDDTAKAFSDQFVADGGIKDVHNTDDANLVAGRFIDWLIVNHWGEAHTAGVANV